MDAIHLLLFSVLLFGLNALAALALNPFQRVARVASGLWGALASGVGVLAALQAFTHAPTPLELSDPFHFGQFILQLDGLSALMAGMISVLGLASSVYSISYLGQYAQRPIGVLSFFTNAFIALMLLLVAVGNAFYFLIFWEMMTLASYFLVIFEDEKKESLQAGYLYMLVAHAGAALIMLAFFIFYWSAGNFDFAAFRQSQLSPTSRSLIFLLAFFGFGAKAGIAPLHIWMPGAYAATPSHAASLLSSVMKATAVYGLLRFCVDLLGTPEVWWGGVVLFFGALSTGLGVFYALTERDLKRMLAYSSVEHVGLILLGIGTGMIGFATHQPLVTLLGFLAALYHLLNHSFFKGLLFLGAGALDYRLHTRNLNAMGGLARRMPWTAVAFLIGALALAAIPPLNGFVSEWFIYQALFTGGSGPGFFVRAVLPLCILLLALAGALAAMVAVKMYGGAFSGPARSEQAAQALESPNAMLAGMLILATGCLALGLGAPLLTPYLAQVVIGAFNLPPALLAEGIWVYPGAMEQALLSPPLIAILWLGLFSVPVAIVALYGGYKSTSRVVDAPWACGYGYSNPMSVSASSFDQPIVVTFSGVYTLRTLLRRLLAVVGVTAGRLRPGLARAESWIESVLRPPTTRTIEYLGQRIQALQMGDIRVYCLYIVFTLALLLITVFSRG